MQFTVPATSAALLREKVHHTLAPRIPPVPCSVPFLCNPCAAVPHCTSLLGPQVHERSLSSLSGANIRGFACISSCVAAPVLPGLTVTPASLASVPARAVLLLQVFPPSSQYTARALNGIALGITDAVAVSFRDVAVQLLCGTESPRSEIEVRRDEAPKRLWLGVGARANRVRKPGRQVAKRDRRSLCRAPFPVKRVTVDMPVAFSWD